MPGEDQERFKDYLELEQYIEELQEERSAHLPPDLTPEQAQLYRMAALLRSSTSANTEPSPEFVANLYARLQSQHQPAGPAPEPPAPNKQEQHRVARPRRVLPVSRRALLAGSAAAAASLVAGTGLGMTLQSAQKAPPLAPHPATGYSQQPIWLLPENAPATWHYVTTMAQLKDRAYLFSTRTLTGYVILNDDVSEQEPSQIVAFSAACTHMGCTVQWSDTDRRFHCPCHGGLFTEYGRPDASSPLRYLAALPRLRTKIENDKIYVEVPESL